MLIEHALFFVLVIALPLWDVVETRRLKASTDPRRRLRSYWQTIGWQWAFVLILALIIGPRQLFFLQAVDLPAWLREEGRSTLAGIVVAVLVGLVAPIVSARVLPAVREGIARQVEPLRFFLPYTRQERLLFVPVCLTAGICEELIYRGFVIQYLHALPFGLSPIASLLVSCLLFGLAHIYQGIGGMIGTAGLAALFGLCFFVTGNLALVMILHALIDLRIFGLLPFMRREDDEPERAVQGDVA